MKHNVSMIAAIGLFSLVQAAWADWTPVKRLSWTAGDSCSPALAVDSANGVHIVWHDNTAGNNEVYYRRSTDGGTTWSSAKRLTWNSGNSQGSAIAIDANDAIHIVWYDATPGVFQIHYRRSTDTGITWDATRQLANTSGVSYSPAIAVDSGETLHVAWSDNTSGNKEIYHMQSINGGTTWSQAQRLTWNSGDSSYVAISARDGVHIAWRDNTPGHNEVYYRKSANGGVTWASVKRLTWTSYSAFFPKVGNDSGNNVYAVWSTFKIYFKASPDGGATWGPAKRLTWTSDYSRRPALAVDPSDDIHIVWDDETPGNQEVYYKQSTNGGATWSLSQRLTWTSGNSANSAIAADSANNLYVVWDDDTSGNHEIYYRKGN